MGLRSRPGQVPGGRGVGGLVCHHGGSYDGKTYEQCFVELRQFHAKLIAALAKKLESAKEGNGTMLDNTLIVYLSDSGDSHDPSLKEWPVVLIGNLGGKLKTEGRHLVLLGVGQFVQDHPGSLVDVPLGGQVGTLPAAGWNVFNEVGHVALAAKSAYVPAYARCSVMLQECLVFQGLLEVVGRSRKLKTAIIGCFFSILRMIGPVFKTGPILS